MAMVVVRHSFYLRVLLLFSYVRSVHHCAAATLAHFRTNPCAFSPACLSSLSAQMAGGFGATKEMDEEVLAIVTALKDAIVAAAGSDGTCFEPKTYSVKAPRTSMA